MALVWKTVRGIVPNSVADKLDDAMLKWTVELTDSLHIWIEKGSNMTDGELILARTNMGALVEAWLKFFYSVYYVEYSKKPALQYGKIADPEELSFEQLKNYSVGILWPDTNDPQYKFVDKIQHYRNAIHSFRYRDIGKASDYILDMDEYYTFVDEILNRMPPVEDLLGTLPIGYISNPYAE